MSGFIDFNNKVEQLQCQWISMYFLTNLWLLEMRMLKFGHFVGFWYI